MKSAEMCDKGNIMATDRLISIDDTLCQCLLEHAPIGMCVLNKAYEYELVNNAFCELLGYSKSELSSKTPSDITHPEDIGISQFHLNRLINGEVDGYQIEKRYLSKAGATIWVFITASVLRDDNGNPLNYIAQFQDISARKKFEEQLRLAAAVFNSSMQAMMVTDPQNRIVATNPAFTSLTGYNAEDVLNKTPQILSSGRQNKDFYAEMWAVIQRDGHWEGDIWNRKKNGESYAEWLSISVVKDPLGKVQNYIALFSDVTEKRKAADKIWEHANYDALTRLPNRRLFYDRLDQDIAKTNRANNLLALLFIDLDSFKEVNDQYGHQVGDELLIQVANRLISGVRASDTVSRLGGDEFMVILCDLNEIAEAGKIAQWLVESISKPFFIANESIQVSASIGIIFYPSDSDNADDLIKGADVAMYKSKKRGKNQFSYYLN
jgi:two-component system CheB/CheR fusion protein